MKVYCILRGNSIQEKLKQENLCFINKLNRVDHQCKNIGKLYSNNRCYKSHQWFWHANEANEAFCSSACSYKQKKHLPGGSTAITANWPLSLKWRCVQELHAIGWMPMKCPNPYCCDHLLESLIIHAAKTKEIVTEKKVGYVILIIIKFGESLLWISLRIINALRSFIK